MDDSTELSGAPAPSVQATPGKADLERLFSLSLDLLCIAGLDGFFRHVNPAFSRALGYSTEDLLSRSFLELVHPDDRESTLRALDQLAAGNDVVDFENRYQAADGGWHWLAWRSTSVPEEGLAFAVARDVTEHKQLQALAAKQAADLARSNADLEQFAAIASHDLQAPLRAVRVLADWIEEKLPDDLPEEVVENLHTLGQRVDLMSRLVGDLLAYSRVGRETEKIESTDVATLVQGIADLLGPPEGFEIVARPGLPVFDTTRAALEQVLRNLISNAIGHHDRATGSVTVSASRTDGWWEFRVEDDGPGIPPENQTKIFEMLWSAPSGGHRGAGMGLALVKRVVDRVGGKVWLESGDERGTSVHFTWPETITV
jgi:PAS domain S-box-containing protein